jgi:hypothetical protein
LNSFVPISAERAHRIIESGFIAATPSKTLVRSTAGVPSSSSSVFAPASLTPVLDRRIDSMDPHEPRERDDPFGDAAADALDGVFERAFLPLLPRLFPPLPCVCDKF